MIKNSSWKRLNFRGYKGFLLFLILFLGGFACNMRPNSSSELPYLGNPEIVEKQINGKTVLDTVYPFVPPYSFVDQDSNLVTNETFRGKIYVVDFIFLSCPTICPKMTRELNQVYRTFRREKDVLFLSHTIDPLNDSIPRLKTYALSLKAVSSKWHFVTGNQDEIMGIADKGYYSIAKKDSLSPGGYAHSGGLLLIDRKGHIRGVYDGTNHQETIRLEADIKLLLEE